MKRIAATLLGLSLFAAGAALAGPAEDRDRDEIRRDKSAHSADQHAQGHRDSTPAPPAYNGARHASSNSAHHAPRKGEHLPQNQRGNRIADYSKHGLRKPGRGNEWRKVDDRYVLMAVASGLIIDIVSGHR